MSSADDSLEGEAMPSEAMMEEALAEELTNAEANAETSSTGEESPAAES